MRTPSSFRVCRGSRRPNTSGSVARTAEGKVAGDPGFFKRLTGQQSPKYLWIGCSDSRVPANQIVGMPPGEVFVHRNVANVVLQTDLNLLSVVQFALMVLRVEHVIVCGHYGCGGVHAALHDSSNTLLDSWLRPIKLVYEQHYDEVMAKPPEERTGFLCELNVRAQVQSLARTTVVQEAWAHGIPFAIHGWIYSIENGILVDLETTIDDREKIAPTYHMTVP